MVVDAWIETAVSQYSQVKGIFRFQKCPKRVQAIALCLLLLSATGQVFSAERKVNCPNGTKAPTPKHCRSIPTTAMASSSHSLTNAYVDYETRIRSAELVEGLRDDLFGESINLYNGSTEFRVADVSIPGNNSLPVTLGRKLTVAVRSNSKLTQDGFSSYISPLGGFGKWDIDVPYMYGMFDSAYGWKVGSGGGPGSDLRCSGEFLPRVLNGADRSEIWSGYHISIPGQGEREALRPVPGHTMPSDGNAYHWVTRDHFRGRCSPSTVNLPGEGFIFISPEGIKYTFNYALFRDGGSIDTNGGVVTRTRIYLMATRVEDRFGNYVTYTYNGGQLSSIGSNDGRLVNVYWAGLNVSRITAHGREWNYSYGSNTMVALQPDGSTWSYEETGGLDTWPAPYDPYDETGACNTPAPEAATLFQAKITHPSNAVGTYQFAYLAHGRSGTPDTCVVRTIDHTTGLVYRYLGTPEYTFSYSLYEKTVTGPGLPLRRWTYMFDGPTTLRTNLNNGGPGYCTTCDLDTMTHVIEPDGSKKEYTFGALYNLNEGRLLGLRTLEATGTTLRDETHDYVQWFESLGATNNEIGVGGSNASLGAYFFSPKKKTTIVQQGRTFISQVDAFGAFARPTQTTRSSLPPP